MKNVYLVTLLLFCFSGILPAQPVFQGRAIAPVSPEAFSGQFSEYQLFRIDAPALNRYAKSAGSETITFGLQMGTQYNWELAIHAQDIRTEDYQLTVGTARGTEQWPRSENKTFQGKELGAQGGEVRLTLDEHFIYGFVESEGETYYIEPAWRYDRGLPEDTYLAYPARAVAVTLPLECGWEGEAPALHDMPAPQAGRSVLACYNVLIALAADFAMVQEFGTVSNVESFMLGVLNNVQSNYDNEFNHQILFSVLTTFISNCSSCDPWGSTMQIGPYLDNFAAWGSGGGFGTTSFGVASLWSGRSFFGDAIGVAYVGGLCASGKYNVLEHFSSNASLLRVLQAHELGHNFNAGHDGASTDFIMTPSVTTSNAWSTQSQIAINAFINSRANWPGCFLDCSGGGTAPTPGLAASVTVGCAPLVVNFTDLSDGQVDNYSWQFPGGTPSSSSSPFPAVTYNNPGVFDVSLTVSNSGGSNNLLLEDYITVNAGPSSQFSFTVDGLTVFFDNTSTNAQSYYWDFGDGNNSNVASPTHTYAIDGLYQVSLTAINDCGSVTFEEFIVVELPMQAAFSANTQTGCAGMSVSYSDQSTGLPVEWNWAFEGGTPATSQNPNPTVTYQTPGDYNVSLMVTNTLGSVSTRSFQNYIQVLPLPDAAYTYDYAFGSLEVQFTNNSSGADSWSWNFGDGNGSAVENPFHVYATDGAYTVSLTVDGPCGSDTFSQDIEVVTAPAAGFSANVLSGCAPLTVQFTNASSSNATGFEWHFPGGTPASSGQANPVINYNAAGTYAVTLIASNAAGSDTSVQNVAIAGGPQSAFTVDYTVGNTLAGFENQSANADSISWIFPDSISSASGITYDFGTDGIYTVLLIAINECGSDTALQQVAIVTPPTIGFELDAAAGCAPFTVQASDLSSGNTAIWLWSAPGAIPDTSTAQNPSFTYPAPGTYAITLAAGNAADTSTAAVTVTVGGRPQAAFSAATTLGQSTLSLSNSSSDADSYRWDFGDGNTSTATEPGHTYAEDGTYTVQLIAANECGSDTASQLITITTPPTAGFGLDAAAGCAPFTVQVNGLSSDNTTTWAWSAPGAMPDVSNEQTPGFTYALPGTYTITLEAGNAAGSSTAAVTVTVGGRPQAAFSATTTLGQNTLSLSNSSSDADSYRWDFGDGNTSTATEPGHTYAEDGTYTVQLIAANECGSDTTSQVITITTPPTAGFGLDAAIGCAPFTVQVNDLSSGNTTTWLWSAPGATPEASGEQNPGFIFDAPGIYTITLEAGNAAGAGTATIEVEVNGGPEAGFTFQPNGNEVQFFNTSANSSGFRWDFGDGNTSEETAPAHTYPGPGDYVVQLTAINECGMLTVMDTVTIDLAAPVAGFTAANNQGCAPLTATFVNSSLDAESYSWMFPGGTPAASTEENPTVTYETPGVYSVTLVAINATGSGALTRQDIITVGGPPESSFAYSTDEATVAFSNTTENAGSYLWLFGDGNSSTEENPAHTYELGGDYTVALLAANECGTDTAQQLISLTGAAPLPNLSASAGEGCAPLEVSFDGGVEGTVTGWQWSFPGGTPDSSTDPSPVVVYEQAGVYDVSLRVSNAFGETSQEEAGLISVIDVPEASFTFDIQELALSLTNTSAGEGLSYNWDFGDGNTSTEVNPQHTYAEAGEYKVVLTVSNACGEDVAQTTVVAVVTGLADESWLEELSLFPNPNEGRFTVRLQGEPAETLRLQLLNGIGQRIFQLQDSFHSGRWQQTLSTAQLASGMYVLEIRAGTRRAYRRVVVQ